MTTAKFKFRASTVSGKQGTLFIQVIHQRVVRQVSTLYRLYPCEWDAGRQSVVIPGDTFPDRIRYLRAVQEALQRDASRLQLIILSLDKVVTLSGPDGYVYDPKGVSGEKIEYMLTLRLSGEDIVAPYAERYPEATFYPGSKPWVQPVDIALPCATQNELTLADAEALHANGVTLVAEVSNMGCTAQAVDYFVEHHIPFAPGKAVNSGGVATSGLEMTQNAMHISWSAAEVDSRLQQIMHAVHDQCLRYGREDGYTNYVRGANVAGFMKVARALMAQGIV